MSTDRQPSLSMKDFVAAMERVTAAAPGPDTKSPKAALKTGLAFVKSIPAETVDQFVDRLEQEASATVPAAAASVPNELRGTVIEAHCDVLKAAGVDSDAFERALAKLRADKQVRLAELKAIAEIYIGVKQRFKSKPHGLKIIEQVFDQRWKLANR